MKEEKYLQYSIYIVNIVEFIYDNNYRFAFDHLQWLFNANYKTLVNAIRPLLIPRDQNTNKVYHRILVFCINYKQNEEQLCSTGMYYLFHLIFTNESEGGCLDNSFALTRLSLNSFIKTNENIYQNSTRNYQIGEHTFEIVYWCQANNRTNEEIPQSEDQRRFTFYREKSNIHYFYFSIHKKTILIISKILSSLL
jgi:hypothetical protein